MKYFFITAISILWVSSCQTGEESTDVRFTHKVASGDPYSDGFIIWTRAVSGADSTVLEWQISVDSTFGEIIERGKTLAIESNDHTAKVRIAHLDPDTYYFYRFKAGDRYSAVGRSKTAPVSEDEYLRFAVVSCSNYEAGYFNAYDAIAKEKDLDAIIHLGDYIYEYATGVYGDTSLGRLHRPKHEIVSLEDYRMRYANYRNDPALAEVHTKHPFITIWDDHEIANDAYVSGAQNHQSDEEGPYDKRKSAAVKAYNEWLPVREVNGNPLYRSFAYGAADLIMLDERLEGRTAQLDSLSENTSSDSSHTILGSRQRKWLQRQLISDDSGWKLICNQVLFSPLDLSSVYGGSGVNTDAWDGYPYDRNRVIEWTKQNSLHNIVFLTGDTHASWLFENGGNHVMQSSWRILELGTTSVSSPNADERHPVDSVIQAEQTLLNDNPHLKYVDLRNHGYLLVEVRRDSVLAHWKYVSTVRSPDYQVKTAYQTAFASD